LLIRLAVIITIFTQRSLELVSTSVFHEFQKAKWLPRLYIVEISRATSA
jgi:hypothetical protein